VQNDGTFEFFQIENMAEKTLGMVMEGTLRVFVGWFLFGMVLSLPLTILPCVTRSVEYKSLGSTCETFQVRGRGRVQYV